MFRPAALLAILLSADLAGADAAGTGVVPAAATVAPGASLRFRPALPQLVTWEVEGSPSPAREPRFPLGLSGDGRYLVDAGGQPWRVQADAAWFLSIKGSPDGVENYLAVRRSQGFNAFYLMSAVHPGGYPTAPDAPANEAGDMPFATPGLFTSAGGSPSSQRYWARLDSIIDRAAAHGMVVMLAFTYLGYAGGKEGWYRELLEQPGIESCRAWGRWLGARYKGRPNLLWFALGDYSPPAGSEGALRARAIVEGIREAGARQLILAEPSGPDGLPVEHPDLAPFVDIDSFYGYGPRGEGLVYLTAERAYRHQPIRPAFMQEGTYEYENNTGRFSRNSWDTRRGRYWSVLGGGTAGDGFGSRDAWRMLDLPSSLHTPGASFSTMAFDLFASLPWWQLRPIREGADPIVSGGGRRGGADWVAAAATVTREWTLAYLPPTGAGPRTIEVDLRGLAGPVRARWFDPASGAYLAISAGRELPPTGSETFTSPGLRPDGTDDWLLVLDADGNRCGSIDAGGMYTAPRRAPTDGVCRVVARLARHPAEVVGIATLDLERATQSLADGIDRGDVSAVESAR